MPHGHADLSDALVRRRRRQDAPAHQDQRAACISGPDRAAWHRQEKGNSPFMRIPTKQVHAASVVLSFFFFFSFAQGHQTACCAHAGAAGVRALARKGRGILTKRPNRLAAKSHRRSFFEPFFLSWACRFALRAESQARFSFFFRMVG